MLKRIEMYEFVEMMLDWTDEFNRETLECIFTVLDGTQYNARRVIDACGICKEIKKSFLILTQDQCCKQFYKDGDDLEDVIVKIMQSPKFICWIEYKELALMRKV